MAKEINTTFQKLSLLLIFLLFTFTILELTAKKIWQNKYNEWLEQGFHGFEYLDRENSTVLLKPNTQFTVEQMLINLKQSQKTLGLKNFKKTIATYNLKKNDILFRINKFGFKGPELNMQKPSNNLRIICIGNSITFGPYLDEDSYPRKLELALEIYENSRINNIEVINAGVMGYNLENALTRIEYFLSFNPDLLIIYLGWNRTILRADPKKNQYLYRKYALYKIFYHFVINRKDTGLENYNKFKLRYDKSDEMVFMVKNSVNFKYDFLDWKNLINKIRVKNPRINIAVITLAGLFDEYYNPSQHAIKIAYPVAFSHNLYIWSVLTEIYNKNLKKFTKENALYLIDFEVWAREKFTPREKYFIDSVHLTHTGYKLMGEYIANELIDLNLIKIDQIKKYK